MSLFPDQNDPNKLSNLFLSDSPDQGKFADSWYGQLTKRLRSLLCAKPLLDLRTGEPHRGPQMKHYDLITLSIKIFDAIVERTGLEREADSHDIHELLRPLLIKMNQLAEVEIDFARHAAITDSLLDTLRNKATGVPFNEHYIDFAQGEAVKRTLTMRLIEEYHSPEGRIVLRLSKEALNLFLNALDLDVEDAQAAAEAVVQSQLARGRFGEAVESAKNARFQSLRYKQKIKQIIQDTKRDITKVDWQVEIPETVKDALVHIKSRLEAENAMWESAEEKLDALPEHNIHAPHLATIIALLKDCIQRHAELHNTLMQTFQVFFHEQNRQVFANRLTVKRPHLQNEVLEPLLEMMKRDAEVFITSTSWLLLGIRPVTAFSLTQFMHWHLRLKNDVQNDILVEDRELIDVPEESIRYSPQIVERAAVYLRKINTQVLLSTLLNEAKDANEPLAVLEWIALQSLRFFAKESEQEKLPFTITNAERTLNAAGFSGDDLNIDVNDIQ